MAYEEHEITVLGSYDVIAGIVKKIKDDLSWVYCATEYEITEVKQDYIELEVRFLMPSMIRTMIEKEGGYIK